MAVFGSAVERLDELGHTPCKGSTCTQLITSSLSARRYVNVRKRDQESLDLKAYAKAYLAIAEVNNKGTSSAPLRSCFSFKHDQTGDHNGDLANTLMSAGRGQMVPFLHAHPRPAPEVLRWSFKLLQVLSRAILYLDKVIAFVLACILVWVLYNPGLLVRCIVTVIKSFPMYMGFAAASMHDQIVHELFSPPTTMESYNCPSGFPPNITNVYNGPVSSTDWFHTSLAAAAGVCFGYSLKR